MSIHQQIDDLLELVGGEFSGARALDDVRVISGHHRIQVSPMIRAACGYVAEEARRAGAPAEVVSFPANAGATYWTQRLFPEWSCEQAELSLDSGERLCRFSEDACSLIQRSSSLPPTEGEVVLWDPACGDDLRGKWALVRGDVQRALELACGRHGAIGLLTDPMNEIPGVRTRTDLYDFRQYTSFWWDGVAQPRGAGFVLTPRQGDRLRARLQQRERVRVRGHVRAAFRDGQTEDVVSFFPGETEAEVWVCAHICHPKPFANDNASGAATLLELARSLAALRAASRLPRLRRGIRLIWMPEMLGTYTYLATHEAEWRGRAVCAINLDMVGERQELTRGPFVGEHPPRAQASFAGDLATAILGRLSREAAALGSARRYALFKHEVTPFSGGSDHQILSDPSVGIGSPMLINWPDKYYHTSADTLEKVDPEALLRAGRLAGAYALLAATAGEQEARGLAGEMAAAFPGELHATLAERGAGGAEAERICDFFAEREQADLRSLAVLHPDLDVEPYCADVKAAAAAEARRQTADSVADASASANPWLAEAARVVCRRLISGPASLRSVLAAVPAEEREAWQAYAGGHRASGLLYEFWMDGRRTLAEVCEAVRLESGSADPVFAIRYARLLAAAGVVRLQEVM
ncbi:MAG TPA: DUF4910 domain-containing protein [Bacillota bacterium]|nr:DUF4910 domain-containing protein [Bacillota bacterium]